MDERLAEEPDKWVQSACVLCSNGCACDIGVKDGRIVGVRGRGVDRVNHGRLGPTAFLQAENPELAASRFYNVVVGHLIGLGAGFCSLAVLNAWQSPAVLTSHQLTPVRVWAAVLAVALTVLLLLLLRASHPPAGATTLLVALGALQTKTDAFNVIIGVLIIAVAGEVLRRIRLGKMRPNRS